MTLDWKEATEKWAHYWVKEGGYYCPVSKQIVRQTYTDHHRGGLDDDGEFRVVSFNSCCHCGDAKFSVARSLRALNEKRKREAK